jgi:hypothetical protein
MNNMPRLVLEASKQFDNFVRNAQQAQTETAEPIDVKNAVASALGLVKDGSDYKFDTNSKAADVIFNAMDAADYKGTVKIDLTVDTNKIGKLTVYCDPKNDKIPATVSSALTPKVNAALKTNLKKAMKSDLGGSSLTIKEIVSAWNQ